MIKPVTRFKRHVLATLLCTTALLAPPGAGAQTERLGFSGGPDGSAFQLAADGIATLISRSIPGIEVYDSASAGSVENLQRIESGAADFAIAHASDLYLARQGKLGRDGTRYSKVMTVSRLYGIPAHLIVRSATGMDGVNQLAGKKVAVGPPGSGAAIAAQRYFESLELWHRIRPQFIDTTRSMAALSAGHIDAVWILAPVPDAAIVSAASTTPLRLLPLYQASLQGTLATRHPYYSATIIAAGTYPGIDQAVKTMEDAALWIAGNQVDDSIVSASLAQVYSADGLEFMHNLAYPTTTMSADTALREVVTPLHAGALNYWTARGKSIPASLGN